MSKTIELLKKYVPYSEEEKKEKEVMIKAEEISGDILTRDNEVCHLTSSAFVLNKKHDKVLCIFHKIYNSWAWVGGHADGDDDMLYVALKEAREETSIHDLKPLNNDEPISIEILPVFGHYKRGKYVATHLHFNFTYLLEADENEEVKIKPDENSNIAWLGLDELIEKSTEPHMIPTYKKIINRIKEKFN